MMRCIVFYVRGLFWMRPVPYGSDYFCWVDGQCTSACIMLAMIPIALVVVGVALDRLL